MKIPGFVYVFLLLWMCPAVHAQFTIREMGEERKPEELVHSFFTGNGITVKQIRFTGHNEAIGNFADEQALTGFYKGLVMATGRVELIAGGNTKTNTSTNFGDAFFKDKHVSSKSSLCDGAVLEIDFIPQKDSITLSFVFGSEEYPEFTGKEFNDVFKILVQPLYAKAGARNIASLPGKSRVSVSTLNAENNSEYYIDNSDPANPYYPYLEFDGFTKAINTGARVTPGRLHRLKIIMVDQEDCEYDSGILLDAYSFRSISSRPKRFKPAVKKYMLNGKSQALINQQVKRLADSLSRFTYDSLLIAVSGNDSVITQFTTQLKAVAHTIKCSKFVWQPALVSHQQGLFVSVVFTAYRKPQ